MGMGTADVVPGVSGGTVAFITGIYEELLRSIAAIDISALQLLRKFELSLFWKKINGSFLVSVFGGVVVSIISLAKLMTFLLATYPIQVWSFFFGLILISSVIILREIKAWRFTIFFALIAGTLFSYFLTTLTPAQSPESLIFVYISGMLAICAMILPGISGAFILLLIGKYEFMLRALTNVEIVIVFVFVIGCISGLLLFARLLSWLLKNYKDISIAVLAGIMLGSLNKVWPWKQVLSFRLNSEGLQVPAFEKSILPGEFLRYTGKDPQLFLALFFMAIGVFLVIFIEKLASLVKYQKSS